MDKEASYVELVYGRVTDVDTLRHGESVQFGYGFTWWCRITLLCDQYFVTFRRLRFFLTFPSVVRQMSGYTSTKTGHGPHSS